MAVTFEKLKVFLNDVDKDQCKQRYSFEGSYAWTDHGLILHVLGLEGVKLLAEALQSGKCPQGLELDLGINNLGLEEVKFLAEALQSDKCPEGLKLDLRDNKLGPKGVRFFAVALQSGKCPEGLTLGFKDTDLSLEGVKLLAEALQSGKCAQGLKLDLSDNELGPEGVKFLAVALQSGKCPQGLKLDLRDNKLGVEGAKFLAVALQSGKCPQGLNLDLRDNKLGLEEVKFLAEALQSGKCPQRLKLDLTDNELGAEELNLFIQALHSGHCPRGLRLDMYKVGAKGAKQLSQALQSGKCPQGLSLEFRIGNLGPEGTKYLSQALQSGKCPAGLELDLWYNDLGPDGAKYLSQALQSGKCPQGVKLGLGINHLGPGGAKYLSQALQSGKCPRGLTLDLRDNDLGPQGATFFSSMGVKYLSQALQSGKCPQGLILDLSYNQLGLEGTKFLAEVLQSGKCPQGLRLKLREHNKLSPKSTELLAKALLSEKCPLGVVIEGIGWPPGSLGQAAKTAISFGEAWCYEQGIGAEQDLKKALECYEQAARLGHPQAQQQIDRLKKSLPPKSPVQDSPLETKQSRESVQLEELEASDSPQLILHKRAAKQYIAAVSASDEPIGFSLPPAGISESLVTLKPETGDKPASPEKPKSSSQDTKQLEESVQLEGLEATVSPQPSSRRKVRGKKTKKPKSLSQLSSQEAMQSEGAAQFEELAVVASDQLTSLPYHQIAAKPAVEDAPRSVAETSIISAPEAAQLEELAVPASSQLTSHFKAGAKRSRRSKKGRVEDPSSAGFEPSEAPKSPTTLKPETLEKLSDMQHLLSLSVEDVENIRQAMPGLKERLKAYDSVLGHMHSMMEQEGLDAKSQSERALIHQSTPLLEYYNHLRQNLNQVFLAAQVIASEMVANDKQTAVDYGVKGAGVAKSVDFIVKGVEYVTSELPIPGIKTLGKILTFGLEQANEIFKSRAVHALARIAPSVTEFARIAETFARRVTLMQQEELLATTTFDDQGLRGLKDKAQRAYSELQRGEKITPLQEKAEALAEKVIAYTMNQKMAPCPQNLIEGTVAQWLAALTISSSYTAPLSIPTAPIALAAHSTSAVTLITSQTVIEVASASPRKEDVKELQERVTTLEEQVSPPVQDSAELLARLAALEKEMATQRQEKEALAAKLSKLETQSPSSASVDGGGGQAQMLIFGKPPGSPQGALQDQAGDVIDELREELHEVRKIALAADARLEENQESLQALKEGQKSKSKTAGNTGDGCLVM